MRRTKGVRWFVHLRPMHARLLLALCLTSALAAVAADPLPGHSLHGEAFNEGPRQAAVLMSGCGKVDFPITTKLPEAQNFFNQGVGQLHGFWYFEAERSFRQVALLDKDCAIAYWGMAMANVNNEARAKGFIRKATALKDKASAREKLWIATLENFYKEGDKRDKKQRALDYIRDLETIVQEHPEDVEAKAFLAWKIWNANGDAPITSPQAVDALLDQVFAANPQHPAHHYRIHLWDSSKPARALKSAAQNGQVAPGIAHMWHMPGHTFSKLKRMDDAAWQQEAATRTDHAHMAARWILPDQIHNYAHNEEWLVRNFNELGRAQDALDLARSLIRIPRHPANNMLDKATSTASYGRTRLIETLVKWELWDMLVQETSGPLLGPVAQPAHESARLRALGLARYHQADTKALAAVIAELETLKKAEAAKPKKADDKKASGNAATAAKVAPADSKSKSTDTKKPEAIPAALAELRALKAILAKEKIAADLLGKTTDLPKDRLAALWLKLGDKKKAEELTNNFPQDLAGLAAKTEMLQALGKRDEAKKTFEQVRKLAFAMDRDLPVSKRLDTLAITFGIKDGWRAVAPKRDDSGTRPALDTLGPLYWQPPAVPTWEALTLEGKSVTNDAFTGGPHVLIFYLGSACSHCMTQVNDFAKAAPDFEKAGIKLAAITVEPMSLAARITQQMTAKKLPPFPIYCDPGLAMFKAFHAYDDFEHEALHAAVFVDGKGRLRWLDISWQPFTDTKFLLAEARRLLALQGVE